MKRFVSTANSLRCLSPRKRTFSSTRYEPNVDSSFPVFKPRNNASSHVNTEIYHNKDIWQAEDVYQAIKKHSMFTWGASEALLESCLQVERTEGIYLITSDGEKYIDWSSGAVCCNLGHTVPEVIQKAITEQLHKNAFVYGDIATSNPNPHYNHITFNKPSMNSRLHKPQLVIIVLIYIYMYGYIHMFR